MSGGLTVVKLEVAPWFFAIFGHAPGEMIFGRFLVCPSAAHFKQNAAAKTHHRFDGSSWLNVAPKDGIAWHA